MFYHLYCCVFFFFGRMKKLKTDRHTVNMSIVLVLVGDQYLLEHTALTGILP